MSHVNDDDFYDSDNGLKLTSIGSSNTMITFLNNFEEKYNVWTFEKYNSDNKMYGLTLNDLKGKYIVGGRKGGMPEMTLEWALKQNGIDVKKDVTIDTSIEFAAMSGAFISGTGDFVTLFYNSELIIIF